MVKNNRGTRYWHLRNGRTYRRTDGPTEGRTNPLIEIHSWRMHLKRHSFNTIFLLNFLFQTKPFKIFSFLLFIVYWKMCLTRLVWGATTFNPRTTRKPVGATSSVIAKDDLNQITDRSHAQWYHHSSCFIYILGRLFQNAEPLAVFFFKLCFPLTLE